MTVDIKVKSLSEYAETKYHSIRPINDNVMVARETGSKSLGLITIINQESNSIDVHISRVLAMGTRAKVSTKEGKIKPGDRVLSVKVVNKRVDDIDMRTADSAEKIGFIPQEHVLAVVTDEGILPCNDVILTEATPDRKRYQSITLFGNDSLEIHTCKILAVGPDVSQAVPGEYAVAPSRFGVAIDSFEVRKKFGTLKLIKEKSVTGVANTNDVEGQAYPEQMKSIDRRLV